MDVFSVSDYVLAHDLALVNGRVHSVFGSSFNIMLGEQLVHIGSTAQPQSCIGARITPEEMSGLLAVVDAGDRVHCKDGVLRIYARGGVSQINLKGGEVRHMGVPTQGRFPEGADILLLAGMEKLDLTERTGLVWPNRSAEAVSALTRFSMACLREAGSWNAKRAATAPAVSQGFEGSVRAMRGAVEYLLGRGLGLTPSGDDVLVGFGCGLRYLCGCVSGKQARIGAAACSSQYYEAVNAARPGRTTAVSEAYLEAMCQGYANEDQLKLLDALVSNSSEQLDRALARALDCGHTSGADGLIGFGAAFGCLA